MSAQIEDSSPPGQFYCPTCEKNFPVGDNCPNDGTRLVKINVVVDPMLGREIDGRYTILEKLGQGGMGAVYRASQHGLNREVAIKVVSPHLVTDEGVVKRFLREAKLASKLSHPNAVAVYEFGQTEDGVFFLVMELVTGRTLDQLLKIEKQLKPDRVVRIGAQVCDALEGAHALSIVHRDLKPSNIMLLTPGRDLVKVLDFGLAKSVAPDQTTTTMTHAGALLGTPAFMPPELALGQPCDGRADLYSLGVMLYLMGSGRLPFISESAHELIALHGTEQAPPMTGVPPALAQVIDRMLRKDPAERYQTAAENREALEAALEGRFTPVPFALETNPSLGPFPQTSAEFAHLATPAPGARRSATEVQRIAAGETIAATIASTSGTRRRRSRLVPMLGGVVLVGAIGGGAFYMTSNASKSEPAATTPASAPQVQPPPPAVETRPEIDKAPAPKPAPETPTTNLATEPAADSAAAKTIDATIAKQHDDKKKAADKKLDKKVSKGTGAGKPKASDPALKKVEPKPDDKPATRPDDKPETAVRPPEDKGPPAAGSGSASKSKSGMPF